MKVTNPLLTKALGLAGASLIRGWTSTLDYRIVYQDPNVDPLHPRCRPRALYVLWHEYMIFPLGVRGRNMTVLISQHRDGELITRVLGHLGFKVVRGSSTRGGIAAVKQLLSSDEWRVTRSQIRGQESGVRSQQSAEGKLAPDSCLLTPGSSISSLATRHLIITPDGPRGPRRQLEAGAIFLASRLGIPIVCMGFAFDRPWRLDSWDRFAIPRPYSRARAVISPYLEIPQAPLPEQRGSRAADGGWRRGECSSGGVVSGKDQGAGDDSPLTTHHSRRRHSDESKKGLITDNSSLITSSSLEPYRLQVEQCLNQVTFEAEQWAEAGGRYRGWIGNPIYELPFLRNHPPPVAESRGALGFRYQP